LRNITYGSEGGSIYVAPLYWGTIT